MAWGGAVLAVVQPTEQLGLPASMWPPLQQLKLQASLL